MLRSWSPPRWRVVHLYSSTLMPPAGCRWALGRSADVIEVGKGAGLSRLPRRWPFSESY
nr:MAG TPA: hypothetical protein [Caudoviricetes sp.]